MSDESEKVPDVNGVRQGDPCWLVAPQGEAAVPVREPSAVLVGWMSGWAVLHGGRLYGPSQVFPDGDRAAAVARHWAGWAADYHREKLAEAEAVLAELGAAATPDVNG